MTYDFRIAPADSATMYRDLASALEGLTAGETDAVANMANAAALIWETLPDLNWPGFYRNVGGELVVGPFQGRPACIRIKFGEGVCGVAAETRQVLRIKAVQGRNPSQAAGRHAGNTPVNTALVKLGALLAKELRKRAIHISESEQAQVIDRNSRASIRDFPATIQH